MCLSCLPVVGQVLAKGSPSSTGHPFRKQLSLIWEVLGAPPACKPPLGVSSSAALTRLRPLASPSPAVGQGQKFTPKEEVMAPSWGTVLGQEGGSHP